MWEFDALMSNKTRRLRMIEHDDHISVQIFVPEPVTTLLRSLVPPIGAAVVTGAAAVAVAAQPDTIYPPEDIERLANRMRSFVASASAPDQEDRTAERSQAERAKLAALTARQP